MRAMVGCLVMGIMVVLTACKKEPEPPSEPSSFISTVRPDRMVKACRKRFGAVVQSGHRAGVVITSSGRRIHDFRIEGEIAEGALKEVLDWIRAQLVGVAKITGAELGEVSEDMTDRPVDVVVQMMGDVDPDLTGLGGYWFGYRSDGIEGFVEVLTQKREVEGKVVWRLACALHEPAP